MTNNDIERRDLPVIREIVRDLPVLVPASSPRQELANADCHPEWFTLASQLYIRSMALNPTKGDIWLATNGGVLYWKSSLDCFTRYGSEHGLQGNSLSTVAIDGKQVVWVAHEFSGISYFDGNIWRSYLPLSSVRVSCLCVDEIGQLWAVATDGVYVITSTSLPPVIELPPPRHSPRDMTAKSQQQVWICDARGVWHFEDNDWNLYNRQTGILALVNQNEGLWLGTLNGLVRIDLATGKPEHHPDWPRVEVNRLAPAREGVWAVSGNEVGLATKNTWTSKGRLPFRTSVTALISSGEESVWIGTHDGLLHGGPQGIRPHLTESAPDVIARPPLDQKHPSPTFSNLVQALAVQEDGNQSHLWIGTAGGLYWLDLSTQNWKSYQRKYLQDIRALLVNATDAEVWIASGSANIFYLKHQALHFTDVPGPVLAFTEGPESQYWAGGLDGLFRKNKHAWELVWPSSRLGQNRWIQALMQISADQLWIGTPAGLFFYHIGDDTISEANGPLGRANIRSLLQILGGKNKQFVVGTHQGLFVGYYEEFTLIPGTEGMRINALTWDSITSALWVGTNTGLYLLIAKAGRWVMRQKFTATTSGLASDRVTALTISGGLGNQRQLWIGTPCGLSCYRYGKGRRNRHGDH